MFDSWNRREYLKSVGGVTLGTKQVRSGSFDALSESYNSETTSDEDWRTFRGNRKNTGYAPENHGPEENAEVRWQVDTDGQILSSPAVADGIVYVGSGDDKIYALSATSGDQIWSFGTNDRVRSPPTVVDGTVYVGSDDGNVYAFDADSGEKQWQFGPDGRGVQIVTSSPTVVDGIVYFGSWNSKVYAVDADTGYKQWDFSTGDYVRHTTPAVADGTVYVGSHDDYLYALDAATGDLQWRFQTGDNVPVSPAVVDGTVYFGSNDGNVYALNAKSGEKQWQFEVGSRISSSPAVADGFVYIGSWGNNVVALDAETGGKRWEIRTGRSVESSPAVADGIVYVGSDSGIIYAIEAEQGEKRWEFETGAEVVSSPAVANGAVFVGDISGKIYALEESLTASFQHSPSVPSVGEMVSFDASESSDDEQIVKYDWSFDEGDTYDTTGEETERAFSNPGEHEISLRVTNEDGEKATTQRTITVNDSPDPAFTTSPPNPIVGEQVLLDASESSDDIGGIRTYEWDLTGDGLYSHPGKTTEYQFDSPGSHPVALRVTDQKGAQSTTETRIRVFEDVSFELQGSSGNDGTATATFTVDNPIANKAVRVELRLELPNDLSVDSVDGSSVNGDDTLGGISVPPEASKQVQIDLSSDESGTYRVSGEVTFRIGDSNYRRERSVGPVTVSYLQPEQATTSVETTAETRTSTTSTDEESAGTSVPGFGLPAGLAGLAGGAALLKNRASDDSDDETVER